MYKKITAICLAMVLIMSAMPALAVDTYGGYPVPVDISVNGSFIKCAQKSIMVNNLTYIPLRAFADAIGASTSWDANQKAATVKKGSHTFVFYSGKNYSTIDGAQSNHAAVNYKDLLFVPVRAMSTVLGYGVEWDSFYLVVKISASNVTVPSSCRDYSYTYDDMLYLSKITHLESGSQNFAAKVGIANTVINRVRSNLFPNTIKDVIFDTKYGTQFPPAHTDKMNVTPSKASILAAKCALNGVELVGNSLYFVSTGNAASSWAHNNRTFYKTLGNVNFYL